VLSKTLGPVQRAIRELEILYGPLAKYVCARGRVLPGGVSPYDGGQAARACVDGRDPDALKDAGAYSSTMFQMMRAEGAAGSRYEAALRAYYSRAGVRNHREQLIAAVAELEHRGVRFLGEESDRLHALEQLVESATAAYERARAVRSGA
jgi:hypothetical protein